VAVSPQRTGVLGAEGANYKQSKTREAVIPATKPKIRRGDRTVAKTNFKSIDEYIATQPKATQAVLKRVRSIVRKAVPGAEEAISYQIPTFKLHGRAMVYFAGWSEHYSIYPSNDRLVAAFKDELAPYEISKGTIRFPLSEPVPVKLIEGIAKFRAKEAAEREKPRKTAAARKLAAANRRSKK
jgi:uncharacterized protein YdhG (YjbR/CyaY superfamily)